MNTKFMTLFVIHWFKIVQLKESSISNAIQKYAFKELNKEIVKENNKSKSNIFKVFTKDIKNGFHVKKISKY